MESPRAVRQPTNTDLTALFGASAASREPAVALATARVTISSKFGASAASREPAVALATASVTIQASWVRAQRAESLRLR